MSYKKSLLGLLLGVLIVFVIFSISKKEKDDVDMKVVETTPIAQPREFAPFPLKAQNPWISLKIGDKEGDFVVKDLKVEDGELIFVLYEGETVVRGRYDTEIDPYGNVFIVNDPEYASRMPGGPKHIYFYFRNGEEAYRALSGMDPSDFITIRIQDYSMNKNGEKDVTFIEVVGQ